MTLRIKMLDGSTFEMPCKEWKEAFLIKYGEGGERALEDFRQAVACHWRNRTIPTKFGFDLDAGEMAEAGALKTEKKGDSHDFGLVDAIILGARGRWLPES